MSIRENPRILCVGLTPCIQRTLQFAHFTKGEVNRARSVTVSTGGKAVNVARALKVLGGSPLVTGLAGGMTGSLLISLLDRMGIENDFVEAGGETRVCMTVVDGSRGQATELVEEGAVPAEGELTALYEKVDGLLARCRLVIAAGALPPGAPPDVYARCAESSAAAGLRLIVDTHGEPLLNALPLGPLLVKLNREELARTCGGSAADGEKAGAGAGLLLSRGARWVLVTDADRPALLVGEGGAWRFTPAPVEVVNGVGCGDAATAGIALGLVRERPMPDAVRLGMACGAANAVTLTPCEVDAGSIGDLYGAVKSEELTVED